MTQRFLSAAFSRRKSPTTYDPAWLNVELARIQQAMPTFIMRKLTTTAILQPDDGMLVCDASAGAFNVTLLAPHLASGRPVTIKKSDDSVNAITLVGTIDGVANRTLDAPDDSVVIQSDGTEWFRPMLTASGAANAFTSITVTATTSSVNLITWPNTYSNAVWSRTNVTVTSAVEMSPVGTLTAALLTGTATDANILHAVPWTTTSSKEIAIYVKQGTLARHELTIYNNTTAAFAGILNIQWTAGVPVPSVTAGTLTNLRAAAYPGGWYRVSCTIAGILSTSSYSMLFYTSNRGAGTAGTVYVWGATAYETATSSAATAVTVTGASYFYGPVTITGTVTASALTASKPVWTDASSNLTTVTTTGTGTVVVMSVSPTITGTALIAGITYSTALGSLTAYATPGAFTQTLSSQFASTVSGATLMGYGTTGDVTLKGRSGNDAFYVAANTLNCVAKGSLTVTTGFGCNGAAAQTAYASGGALNAYVTGGFGLDSDANMTALYNLVVAIRAALVANGQMS